ncbi:inositol monophosphatase family protein [Enterococcus sp. LJL99]
METENLVAEIKQWLNQAAENIRKNLNQEIQISQKQNRTDLVTNIDEETQAFFIAKIKEKYPNDRILAEEKGFDTIDSLAGRVWIIDPIDGTLNFVLEKENFCIMLAIFDEGIGQLGFIYDVMQDQLYWGGKGYGVYCNQTKISAPENLTLSEGLLGMNAYMHGDNVHQATIIGKKSMGVRISGCAGLEFISMLKGNHIGYLSNLSPWDYAAGIVLIEEFGFKFANIEGGPLHFAGREYFLAATNKAFDQMLALLGSH